MRRRRKPASLFGWGVAAVVLLIAGGFALTLYSTYGTQRTVEFTVNHKERTGGDNGKYLVFTDEEGVFENKDSVLFLKFDSSDVFNQLKEGGEYSCDVYGWRFGLFSWYPNIKSCETLKEAPR